MYVSVLITTYNHPKWLEKVIRGFAAQTHEEFELVIADDGSGEETRDTISRLAEETGLEIEHVWHEDLGFRKCEILNKAIVRSSHNYLVFVDGDCVTRRDFLETHVRLATKGCFLSGGIVRLPMHISQQLTKHDIRTGRATDPRWLCDQGLKRNRKRWLLIDNVFFGAFLDKITTTQPTFNGHNASAWTEDLVRVNGFDERMQYGGLDRELGERLVNSGIRGKQIRHRAGCIHLDHSREYVNAEAWRRNDSIRRFTRKTRCQWTDHGIDKGYAFEMCPPRISDANELAPTT